MALAPGTRLGTYVISTALGAGGMGEVYRARDVQLGREVALKTLPDGLAADPDRLMRFEREAKALAALNHPNIAQVYGLERTGSTHAIVMELVEGPTLAEIIAGAPGLAAGSEDPALHVSEVLPIARQIAEALEAAHDAGIVHRDLKPANVKVRQDGTVKVLDFGLARVMDPSFGEAGFSAPDGRPSQAGPSGSRGNAPTVTSPALTEAGLILGTAAYMAPEQAKGRPADRRADIWAFGVVVHEMLTGQRLFRGETVGELIADVLRSEIDLTLLPSGTPTAVRRLLTRCLDRDPRTRLQHIGEARIALSQPAADDASPDVAAVSPATAPAWRQPAAWILTAAVALAAAGVTWWLARPGPAPSRPVTRFAVALPAGDDFVNPTSREIAVSPAGSAIAFEWNQQLWIRRFEERQPAVLVPNVVDVREPFFSPDGRQIGFFSNEQMRRVAASGGPPEVIGGPIPGRPLGVSWADDGYIYVGISGDIARLPETGGVPETVIEVQDGEQASGPQLLPGGGWLLYTLLKGAAEWDEAQVVAESLDTGERRVLVASGRAGRVTPTGHLLYVFGGVLYGRAFDARAVAVTGSPVPLLSDVRSAAANYTGAAFFDVSPRGDLIYIEGATGAFSPTRLAWLDRAGRETPLPFDAQPFAEVRLSPEGRRIAAAVRPSDQQSDVWLYAADRPGGQRLTSTGQSSAPVWSPDGQWIYYEVFDPARPESSGVARRRADLSGDAELVLATREIKPWSISADGRRLAAHLLKPQTISLALISLDGSPRLNEVPTPGLARNPSLSPDGRFVVFEAENAGDLSVYVMEIATGRSQMISAGVGLGPMWSSSGNEIFFWSDADMKSVRVVSVDRLEFTTPVTLFTRPAHRNEYDVSADGQRFLHVVRDRQAGAATGMEIQVVLNWFEELTAKIPVR